MTAGGAGCDPAPSFQDQPIRQAGRRSLRFQMEGAKPINASAASHFGEVLSSVEVSEPSTGAAIPATGCSPGRRRCQPTTAMPHRHPPATEPACGRSSAARWCPTRGTPLPAGPPPAATPVQPARYRPCARYARRCRRGIAPLPRQWRLRRQRPPRLRAAPVPQRHQYCQQRHHDPTKQRPVPACSDIHALFLVSGCTSRAAVCGRPIRRPDPVPGVRPSSVLVPDAARQAPGRRNRRNTNPRRPQS